MASVTLLRKELAALADARQAAVLQRFFKTGKGEYGEGDVFLGIKVPIQRQLAKKHAGLTPAELQELLDSEVHEHRLTALLILVDEFGKAGEAEREEIFGFYLKNVSAGRVNNWDLVDLSAPNIVGGFLLENPGGKKVLLDLAKSKNLWERRIAVLATFAFIKKGGFSEALRVAELLLGDEHDLIHKAVGWMLREVGKRDEALEKKFLERHLRKMPRTALRYAVEKFSERERRRWLER